MTQLDSRGKDGRGSATGIRLRLLTGCTKRKAHRPLPQLMDKDFDRGRDWVHSREQHLREYMLPPERMYRGLGHERARAGVGAVRVALGVEAIEWWILSAGYGLLRADGGAIAPYESTFDGKDPDWIRRRASLLEMPGHATRQLWQRPADLTVVALSEEYLRALGLSDQTSYMSPTCFIVAKAYKNLVRGTGEVNVLCVGSGELGSFDANNVSLKGSVAGTMLQCLANGAPSIAECASLTDAKLLCDALVRQ